MKHNILYLILLIASPFLASAQVIYDEVHEDESFVLNTTLNSNQNHHYTASERIVFNPNFRYSPSNGKSSLFEINPTMVFPPTAGLTGGPNAGDNGVLGSIGGSVNVSALGGATFTIPIEVLPGKDGIQPALSVMYNSQAGNGLLGYGWNLAGISSITRCDKTIYHDNNPVIGNSYTIGDGVNYNEDRFMLDGQRLLSISTNTSYGQDGCLYRTEVDNISRITSYGGDGQNPDKFKVWTKDGYIIEYGYTEDSKFKNPTNNKVAMWMVNKISDYNGNYMTYHYHTTDNHCRIDYIEYTGCGNVQPIYQVEFNYTSRDDKECIYLYNQKILSDYLIESISMKYQNNEVYKYTFTYDGINPSNGRFYSRLMSVGLEQDGVSLNPTTIEWGDYTTQYDSTLDIINNNIKDACYVGDFNGDGIDDIVTFPYINQNTTGTWMCLYGNGDGTFTYTGVNGNNKISGNYIRNVIPCDLNGDGLCDMLTLSTNEYSSNNNGVYNYQVHLHAYFANSEGNGFTLKYIGNYVTSINIFDCVQVGDYLGNGTTDIMILSGRSNSGGTNGTYITLGTYDFVNDCFTIILDEKHVSSKCDIVTQGDFNGDGRTDIMLTDEYNSTIYTLIKNGYNWDLSTLYTAGYPTKWHKVYAGDFNGDGKTDLLTWANDASPKWQAAIYKTTGFVDQWGVDNSMGFPTTTPPSQSASLEGSSSNLTNYDIKISDMDGDGKTDIIFVYSNKIKVFHSPVTHVSSTCTFIRKKTINNPDGTSNTPGQNYISYNLVGKFTSNSYYSLLLRYHPNVTRKYFLKSFDNQFEQNYVKSITNGMGNSVAFNYDYFTNPDFYTISSGDRIVANTERVKKIMIPLKALRSVTVQNVSGTAITTQYSYEDLYFHMYGRGIIGFKKNIVMNVSDGIKTVNINRYAGNSRITLPFFVPRSSTTYLVDGNNVRRIKETLSSCILVCGTTILNQKPPVAIQTDSIRIKNYDINGTPMYFEMVDYVYDNNGSGYDVHYSYNNPKKIKKGYTTTMNCNSIPSCPFWENVDIEYNNKVTNDYWLIARISKKTTTSYNNASEHGISGIKNSVEYTYDSSHPNLIHTELIKPNNENNVLSLQTQYAYTFNNGNISKVTTTLSAPNDPTTSPRTSSVSYSSQYQYRFATTTTNSLNHQGTATYDPKFGWKLSDTDCNNLTSNYTYDFFGLDSESVSPEGIHTHSSKRWAQNHNHAPQNAMYYTWSHSSGTYPSMTFYHKTGMPLRTVNRNIDGRVVYVDIIYNSKGNLYRETLPYEAGTSPEGYVTYTYDKLNRVILTEYPDGTWDEVAYTGNEATTTHHDAVGGESQTTTKKYHPNGWLAETTDTGGNTVKYVYNSDGTLHSTYVAGFNSAVTLEYNAAGMRTRIIDPDYGTMTYDYNAFGEMVYQRTPKSVETEFEYDALGRTTQRKMMVSGSPDEITTWEYSNLPGHLGTLERISFGAGAQTTSYQYDNYQRVVLSEDNYNNVTYQTSYTYDQLGRLDSKVYPSGFEVKNVYNDGGYLHAVKDAESNTLWQADDYDIYGHLTEFRTGNGLSTYREYDETNGKLLNIITHAGENLLQNYTYTYDDFGNFASRKKNVGIVLQENFRYDDFNRLTGIETNGITRTIAYDNYGRIQSKEQDGFTFHDAKYSTQHPHAVSVVQSNNQPPFGNQNITYTPFDKVKTVTVGNNSINIDYGYHRQRIRMTENINGQERVKTYVGGCEFVHSNTDNDHSLTYLYAGSGIFAVAESTNHGFVLHYVHTDNLGSWDIITDEQGHLEQSLSFDAWGNRRNANTWNGPATDTPLFDRGFTGHEHLYDFGLINMNGRVYDPYMSSFLSPDNFIQCPDNSQNFNRYAYCLNNPLRYTDPSGEWIQYVVGALIGGINGYCIGKAAGLEGWEMAGAIIGGAAVGALSCGVGTWVSSASSAALGGLCGGAISGAGNGLIYGLANNSESIGSDVVNGLWKGGVCGIVGGFVGGGCGIYGGYGAFLGGAASNLTSQLINHDYSSDQKLKINWISVLMGGVTSYGIYHVQAFAGYIAGGFYHKAYNNSKSPILTYVEYCKLLRITQKSMRVGKEGKFIARNARKPYCNIDGADQVATSLIEYQAAKMDYHTHPDYGYNLADGEGFSTIEGAISQGYSETNNDEHTTNILQECGYYGPRYLGTREGHIFTYPNSMINYDYKSLFYYYPHMFLLYLNAR